MLPDPATLETIADAGRALGDYGPGWSDAIALGIDVTLIERNLRRSPAERIQAASEHLLLRAEIQSRTVAGSIAAELAEKRRKEKIAALERCVT
jgi:hypothetical protein